MNLFSDLRTTYGQESVKKLRDLEGVGKKIARHRNHLVFTLRCKDLRITPRSLQLKCPINTVKARDIVEKAKQQLVRERIRVINNKLQSLKEEKSRVESVLLSKLPSDLADHVTEHVTRKSESEFNKTKWRHMEKLDRLQKQHRTKERRNTPENVELGGEQLKKWVVNLSKHNLTKSQESVLAKGLNFAPSPTKLPYEDYIVATELACPDKGKATVIMEVSEYEDKLSEMLSDARTYEQLALDPTQKYKRELVTILSRLKKEEKITRSQYDLLYPTAENVLRIYGTPKIHKPGNKVRPIVDYTGTIAYQTSRALADILAPLVGGTEHHVNNSKHLAEEMAEVMIEEGEIFNSHDVVSLFTNTPIEKSLEVIKSRLEADKTLKKRTLLSVTDVLDLLRFVLTTTYFLFRGNIYKQRFGAAMGSPVSPVVANLYMEFLEQHALASAPLDCKPRLWKRYVDDILEVVKEDQVDNLTNHINQSDPTGNIKFTYEKEQEGTIPFLDTLIVRKADGSVKLLVYRKVTHTDQYLNFQSHHPIHHKLGVVRTLLDRMNSIVTEEGDKKQEEEKIQQALSRCGYPRWSFKQVKEKMANKQVKPKTKKDSNNKSKGLVVVPYVEGLSQKANRIFRKHGIATAMKPNNTLRKILVHPKDKLDPRSTTDCVYEIPCTNCNHSYIGKPVANSKLGSRNTRKKQPGCPRQSKTLLVKLVNSQVVNSQNRP
ncbi:uncharacterized protein [Amphiura filiformis]|uniref:uncharacterized protein n=1 Tax=Amphiura filiformis TaxID=82378 RepID=UPI003B21E63D